ncbi:7098_t:CDS:2, partial [Ambispora leptoticha]
RISSLLVIIEFSLLKSSSKLVNSGSGGICVLVLAVVEVIGGDGLVGKSFSFLSMKQVEKASKQLIAFGCR